MSQETPTQTLEEIDGFLVDADTGEIVGHYECDEEFAVHDLASAEWVLRKMQEADARLAALQDQQEAILANLDVERRHFRARRNWFELRYGNQLANFAVANLRGKSKTWSCAFGRISFRTTQPGIEITDEAQAISWLRRAGLGTAVKVTENVLISECKAALLADPPPPGHGIATTPAGQSVKITTGIE